jgi:NAD(P)-dependent dehydrogenase (short-subunit alcohol dehydrogenase family)
MSTPDRIALITGANKGLGFEIARQLGAQGIHLIIAARDAKRGAEAVAKLKQERFSAEPLLLDVAHPGDLAATRAVCERHGRLDILINNAGIMVEHGQKASVVPIELVRATFETNFFGLVALTQALLPYLRTSKAGRIVNHSSMLGSLTINADPNSGIGDYRLLGYNASKAAVNMFTVQLAAELAGTAIKVNAAHPGWVKTDLGSDAAPMEVVDGAKTAVALALLGADGPTGGFFHLGKPMPW